MNRMRVKKIIGIAFTCILSIIVLALMIILVKNTIALKNNQISSFFGYSISYVPTESMEPTINSGDTVLIKKGSIEDVSVGDIIVYKNEDKYIIHRVTRILSDGRVKTKGDNIYTNPLEDSIVVDSSTYYGKYVKTVNYLNLSSIIKNRNFILPICVLIYLSILIAEGFSIAKTIIKKNDENIKKMKEDHEKKRLKEQLLLEVKQELLEELNEKNKKL